MEQFPEEEILELEEDFPDPENSSQPLDRNLQLDFHSVSAKQGHYGSSTIYIAASRRVVYRRWGARKRFFGLLPPKVIPPEEAYLKIPAQITTEGQLFAYVKKHKPFWIR